MSDAYRRVIRARRRAAECGDTDAGLVERAVRNAKAEGLPKWAAVRAVFAVGSTSAHALCRRFGIDPDTMTEPGDPENE